MEPGKARLESMAAQAVVDCAAVDVLHGAVEALSVREPEGSEGSAEGGSTPSGWAPLGLCRPYAPHRPNAACPPAIYLLGSVGSALGTASGAHQHLRTAPTGNRPPCLQAQGGQSREGEPAGEPYAFRARSAWLGGCQCEPAWQARCLRPHR